MNLLHLSATILITSPIREIKSATDSIINSFILFQNHFHAKKIEKVAYVVLTIELGEIKHWE